MPLADSVMTRFMEKVEPEPNSGCWLWTGACNLARMGYGELYLDGRPQAAHRVAYMLFKGALRPGERVCHRCDVPACVNPVHLFVGSAHDNTEDARIKGRLASGERNGSAKLTQSGVDEMKRLRLRDRWSFARLGRRFGISASGAFKVIHGRTWSAN